jgi:hypothetical protein
MDNLYKFLIILTGISLLLTVVGFETGTSQITNIFTNSSFSVGNTFNSDTQTVNFDLLKAIVIILVGIVFALLTAAALSAVKINLGIVQILTSADAIMAGFCMTVLYFIYDMYTIIYYASIQGWPSFVIIVVYLIYVPLMLAYLFSIVKFWRTGV